MSNPIVFQGPTVFQDRKDPACHLSHQALECIFIHSFLFSNCFVAVGPELFLGIPGTSHPVWDASLLQGYIIPHISEMASRSTDTSLGSDPGQLYDWDTSEISS